MPRQSQPQPTENDWEDWLQHPCTKLLRDWAGQQRLELMERWAAGEYSAAFDVEMAVKNAGATGACSIYEYIMDMDFTQIGATDEPVEQIGPDSVGEGSVGGTV